MRSIIILLLLILLVSLFTACGDEPANHLSIEDSKELLIKSDIYCGWCGGVSYFSISQTDATFSHDFACSSDDIQLQNIVLTSSEWVELTSLLHVEELRQTDLNSCAVCADGCDTEITIQTDNINHTLRYADIESEELDTIRPFLMKLSELREAYTAAFY